jgi:hypothetical protein
MNCFTEGCHCTKKNNDCKTRRVAGGTSTRSLSSEKPVERPRGPPPAAAGDLASVTATTGTPLELGSSLGSWILDGGPGQVLGSWAGREEVLTCGEEGESY